MSVKVRVDINAREGMRYDAGVCSPRITSDCAITTLCLPWVNIESSLPGLRVGSLAVSPGWCHRDRLEWGKSGNENTGCSIIFY